METDINNLIRCFSILSLEVRDAFCYTIPSGSVTKDVYTNEGSCGLVIPLKGRAKFTIEEKEYFLEPGMVLHAGPMMRLKKEVIGRQKWEFALLHYSVAGPVKEKQLLEGTHFVLHPGLPLNLEKTIRKACSNSENVDYLSLLQSKVLFYQLVELILSLSKKKLYGENEKSMEFILSYIHSHYDDELSVAGLSLMVGLEAKKFSYLFHKYVGMYPNNYLTKYRMNKAKEILIMEDSTVSEVARRVGYEDSFYFSRVFKKQYGLAPSEYRIRFRKSPW